MNDQQQQTLVLILSGVGAGLEILSRYILKNPSAVPDLSPVVQGLIGAMSNAAGETADETRARLALHESIVRKYGSGPPPSS